MTTKHNYDAVALFSAGLDSLLATKVIEAQGLTVKCLHFFSPFFGHTRKIGYWRRTYGLDITGVDIGDAYVEMMLNGPKFGFGKFFNPCVDCKIIMLRHARALMEKYGATFIITGEVLGQRPMSQRRDAMNSVRNESDTKDILLRPLCAKRLEPTPMELSGLVDRERLCDLWGRGRTGQMDLAAHFGITEIPTPGGGCLLTEESSAKRYATVFEHVEKPAAALFYLANVGRQYWSGSHWLAIGRDQNSNEQIRELITETDLIFDLRDFPGPLSVGRQICGAWSPEAVADAASFAASFSPRAKKSDSPVAVTVREGDTQYTVTVQPSRITPMVWRDVDWAEAKAVRNRMDTKDR